MPLNRQPNIIDPDGFYEELIESQRGLSDEQAELMNSKLVLILANHIGDRAVLTEALLLARNADAAA
jgi:hypothetical protein